MGLTDEQLDVCWIDPWKPAGNGYPQDQMHHRLCWAAYGPPPTPAHQVAHSCGVKNCVNPYHLRWATAQENAWDKYQHGTMVRGEEHFRTRLTAIEVWEIRDRYAAGGVSQRSLAQEYGVAQATISNLVSKRTWGHI